MALVWMLLVGLTGLAGTGFGVPWPMSETLARTFAVLPLALIVVCSMRGGAWAVSWLVFLCGLAMDLMMQTVLGYWALLYLIAALLARLCPGGLRQTVWGRLAWAVGLGLASFAVQFVVGWSMYLMVPDWQVLASASVVVIIAVTVLELVIAVVRSLWSVWAGPDFQARGV